MLLRLSCSHWQVSMCPSCHSWVMGCRPERAECAHPLTGMNTGVVSTFWLLQMTHLGTRIYRRYRRVWVSLRQISVVELLSYIPTSSVRDDSNISYQHFFSSHFSHANRYKLVFNDWLFHWATSQPFNILREGLTKLPICPGWIQSCDPPASAAQGTEVTDVCLHVQLPLWFLLASS